MLYSTNRLGALAGRAPTDEQLRGRKRPKHREQAKSQLSHLVALARYCERRASMYARVDEFKLALAYSDFGASLRRLAHY